jgi:hypothetical protein
VTDAATGTPFRVLVGNDIGFDLAARRTGDEMRRVLVAQRDER